MKKDISEIKVEENKNDNPFKNGVMVSVKIRCWQAYGKIPDDKEISVEGYDKESVRAVYDLLNKEAVEQLRGLVRFRSRVKNFLKANSIPCPYDALDFIPKQRIAYVNDQLEVMKGDFSEIVDFVCDNYPAWLEDYKEKHPDTFDAKKYPSVDGLKARFEFKWAFRVFTTPDKNLDILSPELYKKEEAKYKEEMETMRKATVSLVGQELLKRIDTLKNQCDDDTINTATVNSIHTLLEKIDTVFDGFIDKKELTKMINEVKEYMDGTDADMLKADDEFRNVVGSKMKEIAGTISNMPEVMKQKLVF